MRNQRRSAAPPSLSLARLERTRLSLSSPSLSALQLVSQRSCTTHIKSRNSPARTARPPPEGGLVRVGNGWAVLQCCAAAAECIDFFSPANFNFSPLNFKFSPHPPLFSPHPPVFSPLRYVRSRPTISCELGGCSHFAPRTKQIKTSGGALGQPNRIGWRKTGAWHSPDGTYTAVTGAIRVSVRPACRNPSLRGRYSKHKNNN